jgi:hypothetical protein
MTLGIVDYGPAAWTWRLSWACRLPRKEKQVSQLRAREVTDDSGGHQAGSVGALLLDILGRDLDLAPLVVFEPDPFGGVGQQQAAQAPAVGRGDLERSEPFLDLLRELEDRLAIVENSVSYTRVSPVPHEPPVPSSP